MSRPSNDLPLIALTIGDPAGIGPEVALVAVREERVLAAARVLVLGHGALRPDDIPAVTQAGEAPETAVRWMDTGGPEAWELGRVQASCGRAALDALARGAELATAGAVDALVTGPVCKEALHLAGEPVEGQTQLLGRWAGVERFQMVAIAGPLRVMLLSRHLPLAQALEQITYQRVLDHLHLFHETLQQLGFARPRIALAGLNPHAGERGILGGEDGEVLEPAVATARAEGLEVTGPCPADTVFLRAQRGAFDGVLALYHDQAFIPVKLAAPETGLTLISGLPYLRVSPTHGTAFDIAGQGRASAENLITALLQAAEWAQRRQTPISVG